MAHFIRNNPAQWSTLQLYLRSDLRAQGLLALGRVRLAFLIFFGVITIGSIFQHASRLVKQPEPAQATLAALSLSAGFLLCANGLAIGRETKTAGIEQQTFLRTQPLTAVQRSRLGLGLIQLRVLTFSVLLLLPAAIAGALAHPGPFAVASGVASVLALPVLPGVLIARWAGRTSPATCAALTLAGVGLAALGIHRPDAISVLPDGLLRLVAVPMHLLLGWANPIELLGMLLATALGVGLALLWPPIIQSRVVRAGFGARRVLTQPWAVRTPGRALAAILAAQVRWPLLAAVWILAGLTGWRMHELGISAASGPLVGYGASATASVVGVGWAVSSLRPHPVAAQWLRTLPISRLAYRLSLASAALLLTTSIPTVVWGLTLAEGAPASVGWAALTGWLGAGCFVAALRITASDRSGSGWLRLLIFFGILFARGLVIAALVLVFGPEIGLPISLILDALSALWLVGLRPAGGRVQ